MRRWWKRHRLWWLIGNLRSSYHITTRNKTYMRWFRLKGRPISQEDQIFAPPIYHIF